MGNQIYKHSTTLGDVHCSTYFLTSSRAITPASLSIFFTDPSADYKYSDTDSGATEYISSEDVFIPFSRIYRKDLPTLCPKQQESRRLHSVSALFWKVHTTRRSQEALHGFTQENTRTTLVPTRQDLKEQDEASRVQP